MLFQYIAFFILIAKYLLIIMSYCTIMVVQYDMRFRYNMEDDHHKNLEELCTALLLLRNKEEVRNFLHDLCTPNEIYALTERWKVCRLLAEEKLSYREINKATGASLTTIGRVARFLKYESYQGYLTILKRMKNDNQYNIKTPTESG